jgi:citrate synthase
MVGRVTDPTTSDDGPEVPEPQPLPRTAGDLMSAPVVTVLPEETVTQAAGRMDAHHVGSVVVVDGPKPIGILTERDLVRFGAAGADPATERVADWMTPDPDTCEATEDITTVFDALAAHGYRHVPVVRDGALVGILSMRDMLKIARIQPVERLAADLPRGLEGVVVAETTIGDVRGLEGFYHYRQYNAIELAERRPFEDVWFLLYEGHLPSRAERQAFDAEVRPLRAIPQEVRGLLPAIATLGERFVPLDVLKTAYSLLAAEWDLRPWLDIDLADLRRQGLQTCAAVPTLVMGLHRLHRGLEPVEPHPDLGYAANYLYMLSGRVPDPEDARGVEQYMISTIDHGFNASTFTARVIASTGADLASAVLGAMGALSGPLHGGAPSRALDMIEEIGTPDRTDAWIRERVRTGGRIMGFGHRVYKTDDPRSVMLRQVARRLGGPRVEFAEHVERRAIAILEELKPGRRLYTNVEFYAGIVMEECGLPPELFTPTFASSRVIGWTAHVLEQAADNRLIRPSALYGGPPPPQPLPDAD